ncbi:unnamed protein product [Oppiella nova]|uniref:Uncharacterized protein n=1 Tax=Oppiella nova TaxID=334625 RepID=A0A7R9MMB2_9ACAR|nr:unnamed protein product [Oppiella nova]CAG2179623.1 unnamed protein product [Oppiella nova]
MIRITLVAIFLVAHCAYSSPLQGSINQFLGAISNDPTQDLQNDPCAKKSDQDATKCLYEKIPNLDMQDPDIKYRCCISWVANDCLASAGKTDCTATELAALTKILNEIIAMGDAGSCKAYPYTKDIKTCTK